MNLCGRAREKYKIVPRWTSKRSFWLLSRCGVRTSHCNKAYKRLGAPLLRSGGPPFTLGIQPRALAGALRAWSPHVLCFGSGSAGQPRYRLPQCPLFTLRVQLRALRAHFVRGLRTSCASARAVVRRHRAPARPRSVLARRRGLVADQCL